MPDIAGAMQAIRDKFVAEFTACPIVMQNNDRPAAGFGNDVDGNPSPWGYFEVLSDSVEIEGTGIKRTWRHEGTIAFHINVPIGTGAARAEQLAVQAGEVFRNKNFYQIDGCFIRTVSPLPVGGGSNADDGQWFVVSMMCPFTYWHKQ